MAVNAAEAAVVCGLQGRWGAQLITEEGVALPGGQLYRGGEVVDGDVHVDAVKDALFG